MKTFIFILLTLCFTASFSQDKKEIESAIEKIRVAMVDPNGDQLKSLTSADLSYGHSSGLIENQSEFMSALTSGKTDFKSIDITDVTVKFSGKNTAVVRHKMKGELLNADGSTTNLNLGVLLIWVKEKGDWKLLARQAFKL